MVAVGGAIGGLLIGFAAPYLFNALYDLPVVLSLTSFVLLYLMWKEHLLWRVNSDNTKPAKFLDAPYDRPAVFIMTGSLIAYCVWRVVAGRFFGATAFLSAPYDPMVLLAATCVLSLYLLWRTWGTMGVNLVCLLYTSRCV